MKGKASTNRGRGGARSSREQKVRYHDVSPHRLGNELPCNQKSTIATTDASIVVAMILFRLPDPAIFDRGQRPLGQVSVWHYVRANSEGKFLERIDQNMIGSVLGKF